MRYGSAESIETQTNNIIENLMNSIIHSISRRSSEDYALVMIDNVIKKLQNSYPFLQYIQINTNRFSEMRKTLVIDPHINEIPQDQIKQSIEQLLQHILVLMGKNAGFFFIKEIEKNLDPKYKLAIKQIGIDLEYIQLHVEVEKKQTKLPSIDYRDLFDRVLKTLLTLMENEVGKDQAIHIFIQTLKKYEKKYDFLNTISYTDLRYTFGKNEIDIDSSINEKEPALLRQAIEDSVIEVYRSLAEQGKYLEKNTFFSQFTKDYQSKLQELEISLNRSHISNSLLFKQVMYALIDIISLVCTQHYAVVMTNSVLTKMNHYEFLKEISVKADEHTHHPDVHVLADLDDISETDMRRSIQKIFEHIIQNLDENGKHQFIDKFKQKIEKNCLLRLEELGVNLHMIQLRCDVLHRFKQTNY